MALALGLAASAPSAAAYQPPRPINQAEVNAFFYALGEALKRCDADEVAWLLHSRATFKLQVRGEPRQLMSRDEYLRQFRESCKPRVYTWDESNASTAISQYEAIVTVRARGASTSRFVFWDTVAIESMDQTSVVVRSGDGLKLKSVREIIVYAPQGSQPVTPWWERR